MSESTNDGKTKLEYLKNMVPYEIVKYCLSLQEEDYSLILKEAVQHLKRKTLCKKGPRRHAVYVVHTFCGMWSKDIHLFAFFCLIFLYNKFSLCGCENKLLFDMITTEYIERSEYKKLSCSYKGHYCSEKEFLASSNLLYGIIKVLTPSDYRFLDECGVDVIDIIGSINSKIKNIVIHSENYLLSLFIYHHLPPCMIEKISKLRWIIFDFIYPKCELPVSFSEKDQPRELLNLLTPDENSNYPRIIKLIENSFIQELTPNESKMLKALIWENNKIFEIHKTTYPQYFKLSRMNPDIFQFLFLSFKLQKAEISFLNILKKIDASAATFKVMYSCVSNMDQYYSEFKAVLHAQLQSLSKLTTVDQEISYELCCVLNEIYSKQPKLLKEFNPLTKPLLLNNPNEMTHELLKRTQQ